MLRASANPVNTGVAEARATPFRERFAVPFLFCLALLGLNLGLRSLSPAQPVVTRLPFTLTGLEGWTPLSGEWVWESGLKQLSSSVDQALLRSPLQLSADNVRLHVHLPDGAGIGFLLQDPKTLRAGHVAYVMGDVLNVGYMTALGGFESDFKYSLPADATVSVQLDSERYTVLVNHEVVSGALPLRHQDGFLTLLAQGAAEIPGLLVEAGSRVSATSLEETP